MSDAEIVNHDIDLMPEADRDAVLDLAEALSLNICTLLDIEVRRRTLTRRMASNGLTLALARVLAASALSTAMRHDLPADEVLESLLENFPRNARAWLKTANPPEEETVN